ncbi:transposase family protein [Mesorhizobium sp. B2-3-2]|nr:transposase family protein [Mesorhizobium sp. B2-3-2]
MVHAGDYPGLSVAGPYRLLARQPLTAKGDGLFDHSSLRPGWRHLGRAADQEAIADGERFWAHAFEYGCATNGIEHRTTNAKHHWTNGQVERMYRTIKDATVKRFYYETHDQLR